ncbi:hypothetical protein QAD02_001134 [Eretmocerus hayati]|uniref:Uncharacterized protein n=1 Tax=Eretmocerus hayati TaxID=131215 RepID=A0ACC2NFD7_9HYME|nr:hypothetical protein QAD02_001134 [Eretmocerus hayati]
MKSIIHTPIVSFTVSGGSTSGYQSSTIAGSSSQSPSWGAISKAILGKFFEQGFSGGSPPITESPVRIPQPTYPPPTNAGTQVYQNPQLGGGPVSSFFHNLFGLTPGPTPSSPSKPTNPGSIPTENDWLQKAFEENDKKAQEFTVNFNWQAAFKLWIARRLAGNYVPVDQLSQGSPGGVTIIDLVKQVNWQNVQGSILGALGQFILPAKQSYGVNSPNTDARNIDNTINGLVQQVKRSVSQIDWSKAAELFQKDVQGGSGAPNKVQGIQKPPATMDGFLNTVNLPSGFEEWRKEQKQLEIEKERKRIEQERLKFEEEEEQRLAELKRKRAEKVKREEESILKEQRKQLRQDEALREHEERLEELKRQRKQIELDRKRDQEKQQARREQEKEEREERAEQRQRELKEERERFEIQRLRRKQEHEKQMREIEDRIQEERAKHGDRFAQEMREREEAAEKRRQERKEEAEQRELELRTRTAYTTRTTPTRIPEQSSKTDS